MRNGEGDGERNLQTGFIETSFLVTKKREIGVSLIDSRAVVAVMPIGLCPVLIRKFVCWVTRSNNEYQLLYSVRWGRCGFPVWMPLH